MLGEQLDKEVSGVAIPKLNRALLPRSAAGICFSADKEDSEIHPVLPGSQGQAVSVGGGQVMVTATVPAE